MVYNSVRLQAALDNLWTVADLERMFGVTAMTIHNWRNRKSDALPVLSIPGRDKPALRFMPSDVLAWAVRAKKHIRRQPDVSVRASAQQQAAA